MNPFGTTRQTVGGQNQYEPQRRRKLWEIVPFRPCRPPTPAWIVDWPLEEGRAAKGAQAFLSCADADVDARGSMLGDPRTGMLSVPPGPLEANPQDFFGAQNSSPMRVWQGRVRGFGAGNGHLVVSPVYPGPAILRSLIITASLQGGGGPTPRDSFGIGVGGGVNAVDVPIGNIQVSGFTIFDSTSVSDQFPEQGPFLPPTTISHYGIDPNGYGPFPFVLNMPISQSSFSVWVFMRTNGANASYAGVTATIELLGGESEQGRASGYYSAPPTWDRSYIGEPR